LSFDVLNLEVSLEPQKNFSASYICIKCQTESERIKATEKKWKNGTFWRQNKRILFTFSLSESVSMEYMFSSTIGSCILTSQVLQKNVQEVGMGEWVCLHIHTEYVGRFQKNIKKYFLFYIWSQPCSSSGCMVCDCDIVLTCNSINICTSIKTNIYGRFNIFQSDDQNSSSKPPVCLPYSFRIRARKLCKGQLALHPYLEVCWGLIQFWKCLQVFWNQIFTLVREICFTTCGFQEFVPIFFRSTSTEIKS
jgi:hypothetical protein